MAKDEFEPASRGRGKILFLSVVILAVIGASAYDLAVARPRFREGFSKLDQMLDPKKGEDNNALIKDGRVVLVGDHDGDGIVSQKDVHQIADRPASSSYTMKSDDNTMVEVYSWPRSIPFLHYNAYVIYKKSGDRTRVYSIDDHRPDESKFSRPTTVEMVEGLGRVGGGNPGGENSSDKNEDKSDPEKPGETGDDTSSEGDGAQPGADASDSADAPDSEKDGDGPPGVQN